MTWELKLFVAWGKNARFQPKLPAQWSPHFVSLVCHIQISDQALCGSHIPVSDPGSDGGGNRQQLVPDQYRVWESNVWKPRNGQLPLSKCYGSVRTQSLLLLLSYINTSHVTQERTIPGAKWGGCIILAPRYPSRNTHCFLFSSHSTKTPRVQGNGPMKPRKHWLYPVSDFSVIPSSAA